MREHFCADRSSIYSKLESLLEKFNQHCVCPLLKYTVQYVVSQQRLALFYVNWSNCLVRQMGGEKIGKLFHLFMMLMQMSLHVVVVGAVVAVATVLLLSC